MKFTARTSRNYVQRRYFRCSLFRFAHEFARNTAFSKLCAVSRSLEKNTIMTQVRDSY